jgi:hypothetical protein
MAGAARAASLSAAMSAGPRPFVAVVVGAKLILRELFVERLSK